MAIRTWHTLKIQYCEHAKAEVKLEVEAVFPAEWLPDQAPRVVSHRCSHAVDCNLDKRPSCVWAGTNPLYDPFAISR